MQRYRACLTWEERVEFDEMWGITPDGLFLSDNERSTRSTQQRAVPPSVPLSISWSVPHQSTANAATATHTPAATSVSASAPVSRLLSAISFRRYQYQANVLELITLNLKTVRNAVAEEIDMFEDKSVSDEYRGHRLLFLFQKDLLPGVSGTILETKATRDSR